jgi:hypothetical protein
VNTVNPNYTAVSPTSAQSSGLAAIADGNQRLDEDAQRIASPVNSDTSVPSLDSTQALLQAQAGADVISASNRTLGTLLNTFA